MSVICTRCGSTNVACKAIVNPNGNVFRRYTDGAFQYGQCEDCGSYPELTNPDDVKRNIDRLYQEFKSHSETEPDYASCRIVYNGDGIDLDVKISLKADDKAAAMDESIFYHYDSISDLKSLAEYGGEDFILVECFRFDKWTDEELWLREIYRVELKDVTIYISGKEIRNFYGERYPLDRGVIEKFGARNAAECKWLRSQGDLLKPNMVPKLLVKGNKLKYGKRLSFRIQHHFQWYVKIRREADDSYLPYKYGMNAICLDNPQSIGRRYTSFDDALLCCLNHFNENASIPDRYVSINDYLSKHNCL